jgi:hypothetical protein
LQTLFCVDGKINLMRVTFDPQGLRPFIANWEVCVGHLLQRVHREANSSPESEQSKALFNELLSYPGVIDFWKTLNRSTQHDLVLGIHLKKEDLNLRFFSTIATLGTPNDITLQEIRIECLFPADEVTDHTWNLV